MKRQSKVSLLQPKVSRRQFVLAAPFILIGSRLAVAQDAAVLPVTESALLTVDGDISNPDFGSVAVFDRTRLDRLPQVAFTTSTIWTEGVHRFSGPTLERVLEEVDAGPGNIIATAENNYVSELERIFINSAAPIIASRIDGKPFSMRRKGPLWIMFPFDSDPSLQSEVIYASSVWHLNKLTVVKA